MMRRPKYKHNGSWQRQTFSGRLNPDIILLQEVRDYEACARLGEAIAPETYHVAICSAFKEPFQSGLGMMPGERLEL